MKENLKQHITIERIIIVALILGFFLIPRYENVRDYVENNRQGTSSDYAFVKYSSVAPDGDELITIHGYADNLSVCRGFLDDIKTEGSTFPGRYECEKLN